MISKIILAITILASFGVLALLNLANPFTIGPAGVVAFFAMAYVVFLGLISLISYGGNKILSSTFLGARSKIFRSREFSFFLKYSFVLAFAPIIMIVQQASGGINFFDIILVIIVQVISFAIVSKR